MQLVVICSKMNVRIVKGNNLPDMYMVKEQLATYVSSIKSR